MQEIGSKELDQHLVIFVLYLFLYFSQNKCFIQSPYILAKFSRLGTIMKNHILSN